MFPYVMTVNNSNGRASVYHYYNLATVLDEVHNWVLTPTESITVRWRGELVSVRLYGE